VLAEIEKFPKSAQNRVHFPECGAFTVHRQLDIVGPTAHPSVIEGWAVFVGDQLSPANAAARKFHFSAIFHCSVKQHVWVKI
jgi:hypothetical protein